MKIKRMAAGFLAVAMFASMALTPAWAEELTDSVVTNDLTDTASDEPSDADVLDEDENPKPPQFFSDTAAEGGASLGAEDDGTSVETAENEPKEEGNTVSFTTQGDSGSSLQADSNDKTAATQITASVESTYTLVVPENVSMTGADGTGEKSASIPVLLKGNIPEGKAVYVTTDASPMQRTGSKDAPMSVMASKTQWNRSELLGDGTSSDYSATATLTPGDWLGTVVFNCLLNKATIYNKFTDSDPFSILEDGETSDGKTFESNNEAVAKVDANGTVTIIGAGVASITVSYVDEEGNKQQYIEVVNVVERPLFTASMLKTALDEQKAANNSITAIHFGEYEIPNNATTYDVSCDKSGSIIAFCDGTELWVTNAEGGALQFASGDSLSIRGNVDKVTKLFYDNVNTSRVTIVNKVFQYWKKLEEIYGLENWDVSNITDMSKMFWSCERLTTISGIDAWDTSKVTTMYYMFDDCGRLKYLPDIGKWDTSNVTSMGCMFNDSGLKELPDISNWDTSNVTEMYGMFAECRSLSKLPDIGKWDTGNVKMFGYKNTESLGMFSYCSSLTELPDISNWNTSNAEDMGRMFQRCTKLGRLPDIGKWDISNVKSVKHMFEDDRKITDFSTLANWDTRSIEDMSGMFEYCAGISNLHFLKTWNTSNTLYTGGMFYMGRSHLQEIHPQLTSLEGLENWDVSNVISMYNMFGDCDNLIDISALKSWETDNLQNISNIFYGCSKIDDISALKSWNTGNVTDFSYAFTYCKMSSLDALSNWKTEKATSFRETFSGCTKLTDIAALRNWNTMNVTDICETFGYCSLIQDFSPISNWDVSKVTTMESTFSGCKNLTNLNALKSWNPKAVTTMDSMFSSCTLLSDISSIASWDTSNVTSMSYMFYDCTSLEDASPIKNWDISAVTSRYKMFYNCPCGDIFASTA